MFYNTEFSKLENFKIHRNFTYPLNIADLLHSYNKIINNKRIWIEETFIFTCKQVVPSGHFPAPVEFPHMMYLPFSGAKYLKFRKLHIST